MSDHTDLTCLHSPCVRPKDHRGNHMDDAGTSWENHSELTDAERLAFERGYADGITCCGAVLAGAPLGNAPVENRDQLKRWIDAHDAKIFERGAEWMREQAASIAKEKYNEWRGSGAGLTGEIWDVYAAIRAIRIPPEKR